jgi:hypothetical protein
VKIRKLVKKREQDFIKMYSAKEALKGPQKLD